MKARSPVARHQNRHRIVKRKLDKFPERPGELGSRNQRRVRVLDGLGVLVSTLITRLESDGEGRMQEERADHGPDDNVRPSGTELPNRE